MDPPSPVVAAGAQVAFTITVEGKALDVTIQVARIETWSSVNRVPRARLVMYDGSAAPGTFPLSASNTFYPGYEVEVAAAYNNQAKVPIFQGIVVRQGVEIAEHGSPQLVVELRDRAVGMTLRRKNAVFTNKKDSVLMHRLIRAHQLTGEVADTRVTHPQVVQYYASDWDMMVMRAEVNGFVVLADRGTVRVGPPNTQQKPVLTVKFGESVMGLQAEMDAASQLSSSAIHSRAWDPSTQTVLDGRPFAFAFEEPGDIPSETLATKLNVKTFGQQSGGMLEVASLEGWASAELLKSKLSKIRGWVRFQGSALAKPGTVVKLGGLGGRFDGGMWVSGVHHVIAEGSWLTTAEFGLSPRWYAEERPDISAPQAAAQLPPVNGLQTGVVRAVATDPGGGFRVQVNLPLLGDATPALVWARLATFYASKGFGALFYPEPGDEVVVGFMNDDPRFAVVLGSVYSANRAPPAAPAEKNDVKELVTRGKLKVRFDDANAVLEIRTPRSLICLDDKADEVRVQDGNGNHVTLAKGGIIVESASDLTLKAVGNVTVQAGGNLSLKAGANASLEGSEVVAKAGMRLSATSSGLSELRASGEVQIEGTIVRIN